MSNHSSSRSPSPASAASSPSVSSESTLLSSVAPSAHTLIVLPSPAFADPKFLAAVAEELEPSSGDLLVLLARGPGAEDEDWLQDAFAHLGREYCADESAFVPSAELGWREVQCQVGGAGAKYYVKEKGSRAASPAPSADTFRFKVDANAGNVKYTPAALLNLLSSTRLRSLFSLPSPSHTHTLHILERALVSFPPLPPLPAAFGLPTRADWAHLWAAWDTVTLRMIPPGMLHQKPIDLRHKCLFYIGHIPTFLDMLLSKTTGEDGCEPRWFWNIFERGIDPHIDDPEHCHPHSEVPTRDEDWPALPQILAFRDAVRARLLRVYDELAAGTRPLTRRLARTIVLCLEHEGFHVETLLYMLIQRAGTGTLPPPGPVPPFEALARQWAATPPPATRTVTLGPATVVLGHDDQESEDLLEENALSVEGHAFGWDNESPRRAVAVGRVAFEWRPVSNAEFRAFWEERGAEIQMPASWVLDAGELKVRTLYGPVAFAVAAHWPVLTSYDNLAAYAARQGGRLPTEPELRLFLDTYDAGHAGGGNVGFRHWHPVPATAGVDGGKGTNGGVWEWTSTKFDGHPGLDPTGLFTGYSTDFFDAVHHVVLGASYATIPRLAGRRTLRNFYQHNYPYPWVAARVVYDA